MDPFSLAAVVGLVYAGKRISDAKEVSEAEQATMPAPPPKQLTKFDLVKYNVFAQQDMQVDKLNQAPNTGRGFSGDFRLRPKEAVPNLGDIVKDGKRFPFGQPVYDTSAREPVTNKMNNVNATEKVYVGRGLGLDPNVPAAGGFQQFFRIYPNNINEERLTQLPGNWGGPADSLVKGGTQILGAVTHQAKTSKAWQRDPAQNRGQGQGGALTAQEGRPDFQKTRRTTIRQETGQRGDGLEMGPGQYMIGQHYGSLTDKTLPRSTDNRSNVDRAGNAGRMNVRADPADANGVATNLRLEAGPLPIRPADGSRQSNYVQPQYNRLNVFKGVPNPQAKNLDTASKVLKNNPFAHSFSAAA